MNYERNFYHNSQGWKRPGLTCFRLNLSFRRASSFMREISFRRLNIIRQKLRLRHVRQTLERLNIKSRVHRPSSDGLKKSFSKLLSGHRVMALSAVFLLKRVNVCWEMLKQPVQK